VEFESNEGRITRYKFYLGTGYTKFKIEFLSDSPYNPDICVVLLNTQVSNIIAPQESLITFGRFYNLCPKRYKTESGNNIFGTPFPGIAKQT
jgi:hypothetical protein